jgi:hypothetical protein
MRPRTKREKAAAERGAIARRYGTLRLALVWAAFGAGCMLGLVTAALTVAMLGGLQ